MNHTEHTAKTQSQATGFAAMLRAFLRLQGIGAPSVRHRLLPASLPASLLVIAALGFVIPGIVCAGAQAEVACPNEALRQEMRSGQLPDCRAYEIVSPVFKSGSSVSTSDVGVRGAVSADGSQVISVAFGAFAGTESNSYENTAYMFSRTDMGWNVSALAPPGSLSPESHFFAASNDLTRTLWGLHRASQSIFEEDLYVREPDGHFVEVGPMVPPSYGSGPPSGTTTTFARTLVNTLYMQGGGASADLSHILISVKGSAATVGDRWPGDATVGEHEVNSLYEYLGTGLARPALVGVNNMGDQISQCGTDLGGALPGAPFKGDKYNAVSIDGAKVFFTAGAGGCQGLNEQGEEVVGKGPAVNELYARVGGVEAVKISEPLSSQCSLCRTGTATSEEPATTEMPAEFAGASADGSKAFFMTEQELFEGQTTDNLYEYDFSNNARRKVVLVSAGAATPEVQGVARVSEDGSHVYFVAKGLLTSEPRGGGCVAELSLAALKEEEEATKELEETGEATKTRRCRPNLGRNNLYAFERDAEYPAGRLRFIATLSEADQGDWSKEDLRPVQATPDGRFVVFTSNGDLTPDDTSTVSQVFEYDAQEEELVRVSVGQNGFNSNGNTDQDPASIRRPVHAEVDSPASAESGLSVSSDGSYVVFTSADDLTGEAGRAADSGATNVYEYHSAGSVANGNTYLISDGNDVTEQSNGERGQLGVEMIGTDASGGDVFFGTGDPLLAADANTGRDLYDARIGGGFAEPPAPAECKGEECQGALSRSSLVGSPASASVVAGGNLTPPPRQPPPAAKPKSKRAKCRKGFIRKRGKCVKVKRRAKRVPRSAKSSPKSSRGGQK